MGGFVEFDSEGGDGGRVGFAEDFDGFGSSSVVSMSHAL